MRKAIILLLVLTLLLTGGAVFASAELQTEKENVVFTEKLLYENVLYNGYPADGLEIVRNVEFGLRLLWTSTVEFKGNDFESDTEFGYYPNQIELKTNMFGNGIQMYCMYDFECRTPEKSSAEAEGLDKAFIELYEETPNGSRGEKTIRLADYIEYYPLFINMELAGAIYSVFPDMENSIYKDDPSVRAILTMREYFKIPVLEDEYAYISLSKDLGGKIISSGFNPLYDENHYTDTYEPWTESVTSDNTCFFWFSNRTAEGRLADTSLIPGGYGIYALPFGTRTDEADGSEYPDVFTEKLHVFYPVDPQTEIKHLYLTEDNSRLLLHTVEEGKYIVTVIDAESGSSLQRLKIAECQTESAWCIYNGVDFSVIGIGKSLYVIENEGNTWELCFGTEPKDIELEKDFMSLWYSDVQCAFDGERLAVCFGIESEVLSAYEGCGFFVAVYDSDGLQYCANYLNSLEYVNTGEDEYNNLIRPVTGREISVSWK
ncbi:MAG: hypothetical protein HUJ66_03795 [Oscillospiraceae bacterium]|nr:hypothetical protein [Oscillospiraceae bacterium]